MIKKFPDFNIRFLELVKKVLEKVKIYLTFSIEDNYSFI